MNLYDVTIPVFSKSLTQIERWLDAAGEYGKARKFDPEVLLSCRLAPDQFPFVRQVQTACDTAKLAGARLTGTQAPSHPDTETTIDELRARIQSVISYLETFDRGAIDSAEDQRITLSFVPGKYLTGADYVRTFALPNFFFHYATAYAILRHNGVPLGKADYLGAMPFRDL